MKRFRLVFVAPVGSDSLEFKRRLLSEEKKHSKRMLSQLLSQLITTSQPADAMLRYVVETPRPRQVPISQLDVHYTPVEVSYLCWL